MLLVGDAQLRWDRRYAAGGGATAPSALLEGVAGLLPAAGRALDVAGGAGRHAVWLAQREFDVTLADVSPVALAGARRAAAAAGVAIDTVQVDLEAAPPPAGPWDVILVFHYLQRDLFPTLAGMLAPGGVLVMVLATVRNLERHDRPPREYLLDEGEAPALAAGLDVIRYEEGWLAEDRHEVLVVAQRPPAP